MENVACPEALETTCTREITVRYNGTSVVLYKNYTVSQYSVFSCGVSLFKNI